MFIFSLPTKNKFFEEFAAQISLPVKPLHDAVYVKTMRAGTPD